MRSYLYENVSRAWPGKFLTSQADNQVLASRPAKSMANRFVLGEFSVHNRSGGAAVVGIGGRIPTSLWTMGFWTDANYAAGTVYADDTADAQSAASGDVNLATVGTNNDGFMVGCDIPFSIVSLQVTQAALNNAVWKLYYSIATQGAGFGSNFTEITNAYVMPSFGATGEQLIWFEPPIDWVKASPATAIINRHGATVPSQYLILAKATTAPDTSRGQISLATVGRMVMTTENVADNDILSNIGGKETYLPPQCDGVCAAISVANIQNRADIKYRMAG